jgi:hypothetical protein
MIMESLAKPKPNIATKALRLRRAFVMEERDRFAPHETAQV